MAGLANEEVSSVLRSLALVAGRYGFGSSIEDGVFRLRAWDAVVASIGNDSKIKILIDKKYIIIENIGIMTLKRIRVPRDDPGTAVALAYYAWLDRQRSLESRILKILVRLGRTARPRRECPRIYENVSRSPYVEGTCTRLASLLAYGAYKARMILGIDPQDLVKDRFFPPESEGKEIREYVSSLASLIRSLLPAYDSLAMSIIEGAKLFDRYRYIPSIVKVGLSLASYIDRLPLSWRVYLAGLNLVKPAIRLARNCRGLGMADAGILGESMWLRSGDGSVVCESESPASHGLALALFGKLGGRVGVIRAESQKISKCLSYSSALCTGYSLVLDPGEASLRKAASCVSTGDCGVSIVYYGERPIVLVIDTQGRVEPGSIVVAGLPERSISMTDAARPEGLARIVRGKPSRGIRAESLRLFSDALNYVESG